MKTLAILVGIVLIGIGVVAANGYFIAEDRGFVIQCGTALHFNESVRNVDTDNRIREGVQTHLRTLCADKTRTWQLVSGSIFALGVAVFLGGVAAPLSRRNRGV